MNCQEIDSGSLIFERFESELVRMKEKLLLTCINFEKWLEFVNIYKFTTDFINELTNFDKLVNSLKYIIKRVNFLEKYVLFYRKFGRVSPKILTNQNLQLKKNTYITNKDYHINILNTKPSLRSLVAINLK